jgi:hypothetical protein
MKITLSPVLAATLLVSVSAFSNYLDNMAGGKTVQKYTPPPPKTPVNQGGYLGQLGSGASPASPSYPAAAPAAPVVASGSYLDQMGASRVEKYTPPPPKTPVTQGGYLNQLASPSTSSYTPSF